MKLSPIGLFSIAAVLAVLVTIPPIIHAEDEGTGNMVKMCLFYPSPSGHARTDPILSQTCPSDHMHTFYGPQNIHPNTSYQDLLDTKPSFSTTPWIENQSLYWHPSIYAQDRSTGVYTRVTQLESSPYYRWDQSVEPKTEAFPPEFRMIAYSDQDNADSGGETGFNLFMECCTEDESSCTNSYGTTFPNKNCGFLGLAMAMPTCWNGDLGKDNDHKSHMAYTTDGTVAGPCPTGYDRRLPQVQLFVRINNFKGKKFRYTFADEATNFHLDFMNGWKEGVLQNIIEKCPVIGNGNEGYNPPCNCDEFLTPNDNPSGILCDDDVKSLILNEETNVVNTLPRGNGNNCASGDIIPKWSSTDPPFTCGGGGGGTDDGSEDDSTDDGSDDNGDCQDSTSKVSVEINGSNKKKFCSFFASSKGSAYCDQVEDDCPVTCNSCDDDGSADDGSDDGTDECVDSEELVPVEINGKSKEKKCTFFSTEKGQAYCDQVEDECPVTCNACDDDGSDDAGADDGDDECVDSDELVPVVINGKDKEKKCVFFSTEKGQPYCDEEDVAFECPVTCNMCDGGTDDGADECVDSDELVPVEINGKDKEKKCAFFSTEKGQTYCDQVEDECPVTCNACDDDDGATDDGEECEDSTGKVTVTIKGKPKDKPCTFFIAKQKFCEEEAVADFCPVTCNTCP